MRTFQSLLMICLFTASGAFAADKELSIEEEIKQQVYDNTQVTATPLKDPGLATCFSGTFYKTEISTTERDTTSKRTAIYTKTSEGVIDISKPGSDEKLPEFLKLINPSFKLANDADGQAMLSALNTLFEKNSAFKKEVEPRVERDGTKWHFILDKFFEHFSGFTLETDASATVIEFDYTLKLPLK